MRLHALDRSDVPPLAMPDRFRTEIVWFAAGEDADGVPPLGPGEFFVRPDDAERSLEELTVEIDSPLEPGATTEVELADYHETFLEWLLSNGVRHVRVEQGG